MKLLIIIRKFQPSDFPWVVDIEKRVFNEHDPYLYMQFYETASEGFIVAEVNGMVVGYVVGFPASKQSGRVFSLAVHPAYQNRGIGSNLLKEIVNVLRQSGVLEIVLEVRASNTKAKRFYERHGFKQIGVTERYYYDGENAYLMKFEVAR